MSPPQPFDRYAVLGNPVAHSRSPFIHACFAEQTGEPVAYGRVLCPMDGFVTAVHAFASDGENPGKGCNVTVPFKFEAPALATRVSARAQLAGAANVLRFDADGWAADNTDGVGLVRDIQEGAGVRLQGQRVLIVGAGGGGAGILGPILQAGAAEVVVVNRTAAKAQALVDRHTALARDQRARLSVRALEDPGAGYGVLINASATSLQGQASPVDASVLAEGALAIDLMYGPAAAPFLAWAQAAGAVARDGLGMLVQQAAEAFFFWRGVRPDTAPVLAALRQEISA